MPIPPIDLNLVATVIAAVFGGVGVKIIEKFLSRDKDSAQQATNIRNELRKQITGLKSDVVSLKKENSELSKELDIWQEKYWELKARNVSLEGQLESITRQLEEYISISSEIPTPPSKGDTT